MVARPTCGRQEQYTRRCFNPFPTTTFTHLVSIIQSCVSTGPSLILDGLLVRVSGECPTAISSLDEGECESAEDHSDTAHMYSEDYLMQTHACMHTERNRVDGKYEYHQTISQYMEKTVRLLCLKYQEVSSSPAVRLPSRLWARLHLEFVVNTSSSQSRVTQSGLKPYAHPKFAAPFKG